MMRGHNLINNPHKASDDHGKLITAPFNGRRQALIAGFMCPLRPPYLWVKRRSRKHRIDGGSSAVCHNYGALGGGGDPRRPPWAGWWGSGQSHQPAIRHCTSLGLPSRTGRAVWGWPMWRPVPHRPAGLPGSLNGNDHEGAGRETPRLGGEMTSSWTLSAPTDLCTAYTAVHSRMLKCILQWKTHMVQTIYRKSPDQQTRSCPPGHRPPHSGNALSHSAWPLLSLEQRLLENLVWDERDPWPTHHTAMWGHAQWIMRKQKFSPTQILQNF